MTDEPQPQNNDLLPSTSEQAEFSVLPSQLEGAFISPEDIDVFEALDQPEVSSEVQATEGIDVLRRLERESRNNHTEKQRIAQRRIKVAALTQVGLGTEEISQVLACSMATVAIDRRELGMGIEQKPHHKARYPVKFRFLALLERGIDETQKHTEMEPTSSLELFEIYTVEERTRLKEVLLTSLGIEQVLTANEPVAVSSELTTTIEKLKGYARLADAVLNLEKKTKLLTPQQVRASVHSLLMDIATGQSLPPETQEGLPRLIAEYCRHSITGSLRRDPDTNLVDVLEQALVGLLQERHANVIRLRFGLDQSGKVTKLEDIGDPLGITRERVRQIEAKALRHLREPVFLAALKPYAEFADERKVVIDPKDKVQYLGEYGLSLLAVRLFLNARIRSIGELNNHLVDESNGWMLNDVFAAVSEVQKDEARLAIHRYRLDQME